MTGIHIKLLGTISASNHDRTLRLGTAKERELLAVLALRRRSAARVEQLVEDLWGEAPPASAVNLVHTYAARLRRAVQPDSADDSEVLLSRRPGYQLLIPDEQLDAAQFELQLTDAHKELANGRVDRAHRLLRQAKSHWNGAPALSCAVGPTASIERARLSDLRLDMEEKLVSVRLSRGECAASAAELRRLVTQHPLREHLWALLLIALSHSSRRGEALHAYHEIRTLLADELGVDPSPELQDLYQSLLQGTPLPLPFPPD